MKRISDLSNVLAVELLGRKSWLTEVTKESWLWWEGSQCYHELQHKCELEDKGRSARIDAKAKTLCS